MRQLNRYFKNIRYTVYLVTNKLGVTVPSWFARWIAKKNKTEVKRIFEDTMVDIFTYDGSGQTVHPSSLIFEGTTYLTLTPFPYSLNVYENPCIYTKTNGGYHMDTGPVMKPQKGDKNYLNDPCLFEYSGLNLVFRHTYVQNGIETHNALFTSVMNSDRSWTAPVKFLESCGDDLISPAFIEFEGFLYLFCIQHESNDVWRVTERTYRKEYGMLRHIECAVNGLADNAHVWHIDVYKQERDLYGLFTVKSKNDKYNLYRTRYDICKSTWIIENEITSFTKWSESIDIIYKATIEKDSRDYLVSVRDKKGRWSLLRIPKDGE